MQQAKFSIDEQRMQFIDQFKEFGFKDKSDLMRNALDCLKKWFEKEQMRMSADLYAELYAEDREIRELTEAANHYWPNEQTKTTRS